MLAGDLPFHGDTEMAISLARLSTAPESIRAVRPDLPPTLAHLVMSCLALNPADRPRAPPWSPRCCRGAAGPDPLSPPS